MAEILSEKLVPISSDQIVTGKQILDIITNGMYSNSLMVLREYIQNAVDSIDNAVEKKQIQPDMAKIDIFVDGANRTLSIFDNGSGVSNVRIISLLSSLGISTKIQNENRGFRGIGRLGGIGYCDKVIFETRSDKSEKVGVICWDGKKLQVAIKNKNGIGDVSEAIQESVTAEFRDAESEELDHFFRVTLENVHRFHKDQLMNLHTISSYLQQEAPLPFKNEHFSFAEEINKYLSPVTGFRSYQIRLNGELLFRPHCDSFDVSEQQKDRISNVELFPILYEGKEIGRGWFAKTNFLASLPTKVTMRGIRVRQGNMGIGNEFYLADSFSERRFATWNIGEIHLDYSVKTNARRDDFEQSPFFESFLEQVQALGRHLSHLCRSSSKSRSRQFYLDRLVIEAEKIVNTSIFMNCDHLKQKKEKINEILCKIEGHHEFSKKNSDYKDRTNKIRNKINMFPDKICDFEKFLDGRTLRHINKKDILKKVISEIIDHGALNRSPEEIAFAAVKPFLKKTSVANIDSH